MAFVCYLSCVSVCDVGSNWSVSSRCCTAVLPRTMATMASLSAVCSFFAAGMVLCRRRRRGRSGKAALSARQGSNDISSLASESFQLNHFFADGWFPKIGGKFTPQIIHFNRIGTIINHPFWDTPIFGKHPDDV